MNVALITGISGQDGYYLTRLLLAHHYQVHGIIRRHSQLNDHARLEEFFDHPNLILHYGDMTDGMNLTRIIKEVEPDEIYNLAAQSHVDVSFKNPVSTTISNVVGIHSLLAACVKKGVKKLIVMSTDEVYGSTDEIVDVRLLDPANPYSASKAAADMIVSAYQKMHPELTITTLRSNNIAGPGQFINNIIPRFSVLGLLDRKFTLHGDGSARRRYLWVKDAAMAIYLLAEHATKSQIYHIGHDQSFSNLEVAEKIGSYLKLEDYISFEKDRLINDTIYPADSLDMLRDFDWKPTRDLDDFLPETIEWYRTHLDHFRDLV